MPAYYKKWGISFQYPENWTLDEDDTPDNPRSATVYSPGGAFWSVAVHSREADPTTLAEAARDAMQEEYEDLEFEEVWAKCVDRDAVGYDLHFSYLDLTSTAEIRCLQVGHRTYSIFYQGEDREFARIKPVFLAMTTSLLRDSDAPG